MVYRFLAHYVDILTTVSFKTFSIILRYFSSRIVTHTILEQSICLWLVVDSYGETFPGGT